MKHFFLGKDVALSDFIGVALKGCKLQIKLSEEKRVINARKLLDSAIASGRIIYGVNTGFGELSSKRIPLKAIEDLQRNLIRSHAAGIGDPLSDSESRGVWFLRANELARGYSGCRLELIRILTKLVNRGVTPIIPSRGSVGASGDLAPQAHAALVLIGEGFAKYRGRIISGAKALSLIGVKPIKLAAKEGISLINGTQAMQAVGGLSLHQAFQVLMAANLAGAMSLEAIKGTPVPYDARISKLKPYPGQQKTARSMREFLAKSEIRESHKMNDDRVQDPYSLRCIPQVHGAVREVLDRAQLTLETEMSSVTDNPLIIGREVLSGGNFHGQALAFAFDSVAMAMTALGNICERRIFQLVSQGGPGLSAFLAVNPGLESGFMIPQVTAAALASENKTLAHPASSDSIPTSANKEDFVSMGMWAALKMKRVIDNVAHITAIELLAAAQGVEQCFPLNPGKGVKIGFQLLRKKVAAARRDEISSSKIKVLKELILDGYFGGIA